MRLCVVLWLVFAGIVCGQSCPNCPAAKVRVEVVLPPKAAPAQAAPAVHYRMVPCEMQAAPVAVTYARPVLVIPQAAAQAGEVEAVYGPFGRLRYYRVRR